MWIGAGTRCERHELNGVAHLLEHMVFKGTARRSARQIAEEIEAVGGSINAYTSRESTAYYAKVLKDDVALAVDVLGDIVQHAVFDEAELVRERAVVLQEIGQAHDTPDDVVFDHFQATAYPDQPLGRPVLGRAEIVSALDRDVLIGYRADHYCAGGTVVAAAGRVDHATFVELAADRFAEFSNGARSTVEPAAYRGGDFRETRALEQVHMVLGFRAIGLADPGFYALSVMSSLFGGSMSSRLFQEIRERRGLVYAIDTFVSAYSDAGVLGVYAGTGEGEVARTGARSVRRDRPAG